MNLGFDCGQAEMWVYTKSERFGPFCHGMSTSRHKRDGMFVDETEILGKQFHSDEVDIVFKNGGGMRFTFGFEFSFDFFPGLPGTATSTCSYKSVRASNIHFGERFGNSPALAVWVELTGSLYDFNRHYYQYRQEHGSEIGKEAIIIIIIITI